ncbi:MAG: FKBP-type peptidyl-prolyl cis-trans isomerase [Bacteroidaceae bacterium]|nr:FKBP-type peptidyl-prolyl cis-trans isomerase [Bacteroidaceae bacterium]
MKTMKFATLVLCLLIAVSTSAANTKKKSKKAKKEEVVEKVDTVSMADFSYAYGIAQTNGLVNYLAQRMGVDTAYMSDFLQGFEQTEMTDADKKEKARLAGIEIRQQVENQIVKQVNRQINDSIDLLHKDLFVQGFRESLAGTARLTSDSAQAIANKQIEYYQKVKMEAKYGQNRIDGENFLKANAKKDSVQTTASGLQYKILTVGTGATPTANQKVKVNYEGRLLDGTVFDSSYKRGKPAEFACSQVIKGWTEALTMMPVGSKWELYIPQELGYGAREAGKIPPLSTLIFTVELLEIVK